MSCPKCKTKTADYFADHPSQIAAAKARPNLRVVACADCLDKHADLAADVSVTGTSANPDGTTTVTYSDGTSEVQQPGSSWLTQSVTNSDGSVTNTYSDGSTQTFGSPSAPLATPPPSNSGGLATPPPGPSASPGSSGPNLGDVLNTAGQVLKLGQAAGLLPTPGVPPPIAAPRPVAPVTPPKTAAQTKQTRELEIILLAGVIIIGILGVIAWRRSHSK